MTIPVGMAAIPVGNAAIPPGKMARRIGKMIFPAGIRPISPGNVAAPVATEAILMRTETAPVEPDTIQMRHETIHIRNQDFRVRNGKAVREKFRCRGRGNFPTGGKAAVQFSPCRPGWAPSPSFYATRRAGRRPPESGRLAGRPAARTAIVKNDSASPAEPGLRNARWF